MVRAILDGTKTQTRRVVKPRKDLHFGVLLAAHELAGEVNGGDFTNSPHGQPGDRLWVRETTYDVEQHGWVGPVFVESDEGRSAAEWGYGQSDDPDHIEPYEMRKRPAIHMPRSMCRLVLEITGVRVERLNSISEADARAEGSEAIGITFRDDADGKPRKIESLGGVYRDGFRILWESISGPGSWDANPWVWVIEFKRVDGAKGA
ncbi:hypothetical protein [Pandoraea sp. PE-S2T-3]|uniref:hypothetical protein n=1 Tax=Pandoraea sp. PE-S2T-3 TaxID=1986993 RepID=UPI0020CF7E38|nr:hypothetical protein [Pandoraea sp. PE-S2T-3]